MFIDFGIVLATKYLDYKSLPNVLLTLNLALPLRWCGSCNERVLISVEILYVLFCPVSKKINIFQRYFCIILLQVTVNTETQVFKKVNDNYCRYSFSGPSRVFNLSLAGGAFVQGNAN